MPTYQPNGFDPSVLPQGSNPDALTIDQVNIAMRASPVWNQWMAAHGKDPASVHLNGSDKNGLGKTLELNGFPLPEGWEIDDSGNIREETHIGRNILIAAAIAGAAFGGYALLAAYGASAGAGAGGAAAGLGGVEAGATSGLGAAAAGGTLGSAAAGNAALAAGIGGAGAAGAAGAGAAGAAGLGGVEGSAVAGLGAEAAGGTLGSAGAANAALGSGAAGVGGGAFDAAGNFVGDTTYSGAAGSGGASTYSQIARAAQAARGIGGAISNATEADAEGRRVQQNTGLVANGQNIQGQSAFENELLSRARLEEDQRKDDAKNVYRASVVANPHVSPFSRSGAPQYSDQYRSTVGSLANQGSSRLSSARQYDTTNMPALRPYTPINPADVQGATGSSPSTLSRIGSYVGPALSTYATLAQIYGW